MIDLQQTWVPQMLSHCDLIANPDKLRLAFNQEPGSIWTSVTGYDELVSQVFDDLDAIGMLSALEKSEVATPLRRALVRFVHAFQNFDRGLDGGEPDLGAVEWGKVKVAAGDALAAQPEMN